MLAHVGQRLAQDRKHLGQRTSHDNVDRTAERGPTGWISEHGPQLVHEVENLGVQALLVDRELNVEDRLAELADRVVDLVDGFPDTHDRLGPLHQACRPLQRQPDRKQALNHGIVQVPGDPVPVLGRRTITHEPVEAGVLNGDARGHGERDHQLLVVLGELVCGLLVGQVEVPVDLTVDSDGNPQERGHGGVIRGRPEAVRAIGRVGQPERLVVHDESAEHAPPGGACFDGLLLLVGEANRDELVECPPVLGQDAERPVSGVDEIARLFDDPSEHHRQMQLAVEDKDRLNQASQPDGIVDMVERLHGPTG